jgi:hypothetical protein
MRENSAEYSLGPELKVALEMGNSAAIVMKHYFDIVEPRAAKEYWNIRPLPRGDSRNIVSMR